MGRIEIEDFDKFFKDLAEVCRCPLNELHENSRRMLPEDLVFAIHFLQKSFRTENPIFYMTSEDSELTHGERQRLQRAISENNDLRNLIKTLANEIRIMKEIASDSQDNTPKS